MGAGPVTTQPAPSPGSGVRPTAGDDSPVRRSTPQLLRRLSSGLVALGVVVGLVGAVTFAALAYTLDRAQADTAQLIRVQNIETDLLSADAAATNAFLVGGLEPAAQRAGYDRAMTETSTLIADAARAQPADEAALAVLNSQVLDYAATIEQARANTRQGLPVGAQYLRQASSQLRSDALPVLDELVGANAARAQSRMGVGWGVLFPVVTLLGLVALVLAQRWLATRFHRRLNVGLLAASGVLVAALIGSSVGLVSSSRSVASVRQGSFAAVNDGADARIEAYDAKSNESLTLVARGSGQPFESAWSSSATKVQERIDRLDDPDLVAQWDAYTAVHRSIRKADDGGSWDAAVATATGSGTNSANLRFTTFDASLAAALDRAAAQHRDAPLDVLIQISLDGDPDRGGVPDAGLDELAEAVAAAGSLRLGGVMGVAPVGWDPDRAFALLRESADRLSGHHPGAEIISAGMSGDLEDAVGHGATHVRIGTSLLGMRNTLR